MFIAHRGLYNEKIRENSISAFDKAFREGYDAIELDVRLTKDNIPVVIHDSFLSRVSDGVGLVKNYTYEELTKFNIGIDTIERIPKLTDVLNRYHNHIIFIELKEKIDILPYLNQNNTYYISSFHYDYIKDIPKSNYYKIGVINYVLNNKINLNRIDFIMILDSIINDKLIKKYRNKNIEVVVYGVGKKINKYYEDLKYMF